MKLKYDFVVKKVANSYLAVPVGEENRFGGYIKLNETAAFIFSKLKSDITREELINCVLENFEGCTKTQVESAVDNLVDRLSTADVI